MRPARLCLCRTEKFSEMTTPLNNFRINFTAINVRLTDYEVTAKYFESRGAILVFFFYNGVKTFKWVRTKTRQLDFGRKCIFGRF